MNRPVVVSTSKFSYSNKKFVGEISDLGLQPGQRLERIVLVSEKTGKMESFSFSREERDPEGELTVLVFKGRHRQDLELHLLND